MYHTIHYLLEDERTGRIVRDAVSMDLTTFLYFRGWEVDTDPAHSYLSFIMNEACVRLIDYDFVPESSILFRLTSLRRRNVKWYKLDWGVSHTTPGGYVITKEKWDNRFRSQTEMREYHRGFMDGESHGYKEGIIEGKKLAAKRFRAETEMREYHRGFTDGESHGYKEGIIEGKKLAAKNP